MLRGVFCAVGMCLLCFKRSFDILIRFHWLIVRKIIPVSSNAYPMNHGRMDLASNRFLMLP